MIGDPVGHTLSPRIFAWLFAHLALDRHHYTAFRVPPPELPAALARVRRGLLSGLSVTLPFKEAVIPLLDCVDAPARRFGAVNCVVRGEDGLLTGYNTDAQGFRRAVELGGGQLGGARIVLLGAGGAGRAAAFAAVAQGASRLVIANRTRERAVRLGLDLVDEGIAVPDGPLRTAWTESGRPLLPPGGPIPALCRVSVAPLHAKALAPALAGADLLVNATSVGLSDPTSDPLPPGCRPEPGALVLDMVYRPLRTALLRRAEAEGAIAVDGQWMLVYQALEQLRLWTGRAVDDGAAAALHAHLGGSGP